MPEDYESAAIRHFEDAVALQSSGRLDNAGHLVGFAAECAIKSKIRALQSANDAPHGHLPDLLLAARKQLGPRSNYTQMFDLLKPDTFSGWNVNRRYHATGGTTEQEVTKWFKMTSRLLATAGLKARK